MSPRHPATLLIETLEPRILYSADLMPVASPGGTTVAGEQQLLDQTQPTTAQAELLFVDSRISNYQTLVDDFMARADAGRHIEVIVIGADEDGVAKVSETLAGRQDVSAVHLLSHGESGAISLGSSRLDSDTLLARAPEIAAWGSALQADGDILVYGCEVAEGSAGKLFIDQLATLTGADVGASENLTGTTAQGGDWNLEYRVGTLEYTVATSRWEGPDWEGVLLTYTVTSTADILLPGTLRWAIDEANLFPDADTIAFNIAGTGVHTITLASALPSITWNVTLDATTDDSFAANGNKPAIVLDGNNLSSDGLVLTSTADGSTIRGLVITNFAGDGIQINSGSDGNTIAGNYIGKLTTSGTLGTTTVGLNGIYIQGANNTIGGSTAADRNIIAGTTDDAIEINGEASDGNIIQGNWIGLAADSTTVLGTSRYGIWIQNGADNTLIGGSTLGQGNVIVGTDGLAISIDGLTSGTLIRGNYLGTDSTLTVSGGNYDNINLAGGAHDNMIGGTGATDGNYLANSDWNGIYLWPNTGTGNAFLGNRLWNNGAIGIDLVGGTENSAGITANDTGDADTGANNLQNFPVLTLAKTDGSSQVSVSGTFNSTASSYFRIELFASASADSAGYGEGQIYLGFVNVATNGSGNATFSTTLAASVPVGYSISATATKSNVTYTTFTDTSEFARNIIAVSSTQATIVVDTTADTNDGDTTSLSTLLANKGADGFISLREAIAAANNTANGAQADRINFGIAGTGVHTIALGSALPSITDAVILDATTDDSFAANGSKPAIVLDGNNRNTDGLTLSNTADGSTIRGLVIQHFNGDGIQIDSGSDGNTIAGNFIGSISAGGSSGGVGNTAAGVYVLGANNIIGGTSAADRNIISGNVNGVVIDGASATGNQLIGNYIGTDYAGNTAIANNFDGVRIQNGATANTIGGSNTNQRNIISGNGYEGVQIDGETSDGNIVKGNWIGIGANGTTVLGTAGDGIYIFGGADNSVIGGAGVSDGNWIASPAIVGIEIDGLSSGTLIQGNRIGTDLAGTANWGSLMDGMLIESGAFNNQVADNIVAFSGQGNVYTNGILLYGTAGTGNALLRNSVYSSVGMGIDLNDNGITLNDTGDGDTGTNNLQNFPVLTLAKTDGSSQVSVSGTFNSTASSYFRIELFASPTADGTGYGEGQIYLGFVNVATNGSGNATFSTTLAASVPAGYSISATATKSNATYSTFTDTSEFARSIVAISSTQGILVVDTASDTSDGDTTSLSTLLANKGADGFVSLREAIAAANNTANGSLADLINFGIAGTGVHTITLGSALPSITDAVILDATTDNSFAANGNKPAVVLNGSGVGPSNMLNLGGSGGSTVRGLVITNYTTGVGIYIAPNSNGNTIVGNYIGSLDTNGNLTGVSSGYGLEIRGSNNVIGGSTAADRNVVAVNRATVFNLIINGINGAGTGSGNIVKGNYFGTDATGTTVLTASLTASVSIQQTGGANGGANNTIGGAGAGEGNVIATTGSHAVMVSSYGTGNVVQGNRIGVSATGTRLSAGTNAYYHWGGAGNTGGSLLDNWISGSTGATGTVYLTSTTGMVVQGNRIGTDLAGTANWGSSYSGINLASISNNLIGGTGAGQGNIVAFSNQIGSSYDGLYVNSGTGNAILGNSIYGTVAGTSGLGLDLGTTGITANDTGDADTGANNLQNFPVLTSATTNTSNTLNIIGSLNSGANSYYRIEFFASPTASSSGYGEGATYLGFANVATNGSGNATFGVTLSAAVPVGYAISATATKSVAGYGSFTDTSEFAQSITTTAVTSGVLVVDTASDTSDGNTTSITALLGNKGADGFISLREAIAAANNTANIGGIADTINFAISGTGVHTISLGSILPTINEAVVINATTDDSFSTNGNKPAIVLDGANLAGDGLTLSSTADGSTIRGLVIQHFNGDGIQIDSGSDGNTIAGNYIGKLTTSGTTGTTSNAAAGINVFGSNNTIGGVVAADRNVISGNTSDGVTINGGTGNQVTGNYIGTDASGNLANGNLQNGVYLLNGATGNSILNNVIAENTADGVWISGESSDGNIVRGNRIGLGADGTTVLGMGSDGIYISGGSDNNLIGGSNPGEGNTVVGVDWAIWINGASSGNLIRGNYVGTDSSLTLAGGNNDGIVLDGGAFNNTVGGTAAADRNYVTNSASYGIDLKVTAGTGNALLGNQIWNNAALGIDLGNIGVQANDTGDADTGTNNLQNFPVLTLAKTDGSSQITVGGTLNSIANSYFRIELFANPSADPLGYGEGQIYLGFVNVATDGSGNATFSTPLAASVPVEYSISATATKSDATYSSFTDTSEFARNIVAISSTQGVLVVDTAADTNDGDTTSLSTLLANKGADGFISLREAIAAANNTANGSLADLINFGIAGTGVHTITLGSALPSITDAVTIDASTDDSFAANGSKPAVVLNGNSLNVAGLTLTSTADGSTIRGLVIKNFGQADILIQSGSSGNTIAGNYLGALDSSGNYDASIALNAYVVEIYGDNNILGGSTAADRNVIVSNTANYGIFVNGAGAFNNRIIGNYIGTDATGNTSIGASFTAASLFNSGANNQIGGSAANEGNVLARTIYLFNPGSGSVIQGNRIGVTADGTSVLSGLTSGIRIESGNGVSIRDNWIANAGGPGIWLRSSVNNTVIDGNRIGTDLAGTANWGVTQNGVYLEASNNNTEITNNIIAYSNKSFSSYDGITIVSGTGNTILGNSIYGTFPGSSGLGIDLGTSGVTANDAGDADTGANNLQNFPVLTLAKTDGSGQVSISGTLNSTAGSYFRIELFATPTASSSGYGEGKTYLGFVNVATDGSGNASFSTTLSTVVPAGHTISATATKADSTYTTFTDTSEFAADLTAGAAPINTVPGAQSVNEDTALAISGVSVANQGVLTMNVDLGVLHGTISVSLAGGAVISSGANGSAALTLSGSTAQINAALATISYQGLSNYNGSDTLSMLSSDASLLTSSSAVAITVNPVNDAPVLSGGAPVISNVSEDNSNPGGTLVSSLLGTRLSDADTGALQGIAIIGSTGSVGQWQYFNGSAWVAIGLRSASNALLLNASDQVHFRPDGTNGGSATLTFLGWDRTSGTRYGSADASVTGGSTAFSVLSNTANVTITSANDAPVLTPIAPVLTGVSEDAANPAGQTVASFLAGSFSDVDTGAVQGIAITAVTGASGQWQYSLDGGGSWTAVGTVDAANSLLLRATDHLRFLPDGSNGSSATVTYRAWDQSSGSAGAKVSTAVNGGNAPFSTALDTATLAVTPVNDAPVLAAASPTLPSIDEDQANPSGTLVSTLLGSSITDVDNGALQGMAIVASTGSNGRWQYDTGSGWTDFGSVSASSALLLRTSDQVRFLPDGLNGGSASFSYRAWDQSTGSAGSLADTTVNGGTSAFSTATDTSTLTVTSINDAPTLSNGATVTLPATDENTTSAPILVSSLLTSASWADVDNGALKGLAITAAVGNGTWQYSTNGVTWTAFGSVSASSALLLTDSSQIRYIPDGSNGETATFAFKAWDQTTGSGSLNGAPSYANPGAGGGSTAYSSQDASASLSVTTINDAPIITSNGGGATASITLAENVSAVTTVTATDADLPAQTLTYSISGTDAGRFTIDANTGVLTFSTAPDYDNPADSDTNNIYEVTVTVSDGSLSDSQNISITVTPLNDNAPVITSNGGGATANINVPENNLAITTVTATDADLPAQTLTYNIIGGADAGLFFIDSNTGALSFLVAPDFEAPADSGGNNVYDLIVQVSDGSLTGSQTIGVTVTNTNDNGAGPISDTNAAANSVAENAANGTTVGITAQAVDPDVGDTISYTLDNDAGGRFAINASTGIVTVTNSTLLNYEGATSHNIVVRATSSDSSFTTANFTINLSDVNEFAVSAVSDTNAAVNAVAENAANGTVVGITAFASDADGTNNTVTYSLSNSDGGRFAIDANTGIITVANGSMLNYEAATSHNIQVRATSSDTSFSTANFTISLGDVNEFTVSTVSDTNGATDSVAENAANGTVVGINAFASDADGTNNTVTYSLDNDASGRFAIDANTGVVTVANGSLLNYEAANSHNILVRATSSDTSFTTANFTISLTDVNEFAISAVTDTDATANSVAENAANGTVVGVTAFASDADGSNNTVTYSLSNDAGGRFTIDANTGVVTVANGLLLDYEAATSHGITVLASSPDGSTSSQAFTINLSDVNEFAVSAVSDTNAAVNTVAENAANGSVVGITAFATDADGTSNTVTYSLSNSDGGRFAIDTNTGVVTVANSGLLDYEAATSHAITVLASSADGSTSSQVFTISVTPVNDNNPVITSDGGAATASVNVAENTTAVTTVTASDADLPAQTLSYSIIGGADAALFSINSSTGALSFITAPDFETPADSGGNNVYDLVVQVSDGSLTDTQAIAVTVTNTNDNGASTVSDTNLTANSVAENAASGTTVGITAFAIDQDVGDTISYSLDNDAGGLFTIDANTGIVTVANSSLLDYEAATNHNIVVRATSSDTSFTTANFTINLSDVNEFNVSAVSDTNAAADNVAENVANGTVVGVTAFAADADGSNNLVTYSLSNSAGGRFAIDTNTGIVTVANSGLLDYEAATNHSITVLASSTDGSTSSQVFTISLSDINEFAISPVSDTNGAPDSVAENGANGTVVGITAFASDADGSNNTVIYSLSNSAGGRFTIDANTGIVTVANSALLDYEAATSHSITVLATSADGSTSSQAFTISLTDVNEFTISAVSDTDATANSVAENAANGTVVGVTAFASDADGSNNTVTYSLSNDAGGRFSIDANTGIVTVANGLMLDYEAATSHGITVLASSSDGSTSSQAFTVTLSPVNDNNPAITSNGGGATASVNVAENTTAVTTVTVNDADLPAQTLSYSIIGGADAALFTINSSTGALSFITAPDFEAPTDSGGNNVYDVVVQVSDGTLTDSQSIAVSVFNSNEAPTTSPLTLTSIAEDSGPRLITQLELLANAADIDGPSLSAVGLAISAGNGSLVDNGNGTWTYTPALNANGSVSFTYTVTDGSLTAAGSATLGITPVNDAPTISAGTTTTLPTTDQLTASGSTSVASLLGSGAWADVDSGAQKGVAVIGSSGMGTWQYSTDGSTWTAFGNVSGGNALLLADTSQIRYVPDGINGEIASFSYRAWDQTAGSASSNGTPRYANPGSGGGSSAYSAQQAGTSLTVTLSGTIPPITPPPPTIPIVPLSPVVPVTPPPPTTGTTQPGTGSTQQPPSTALPAIGDLFFTPVQPTGAGHLEPAGITTGQDSQLMGNSVDFYSTRRWNVSYPALQFKLQSIALQSTPGYSINTITQLDIIGTLSADHLRGEATGIPAMLDEGFDKLISPAGVVTASGVVFSAGMIWWAARAGGLMASLALSLPTWRNIDPLSVVGRKKDDPEDWGVDDDKDLERLRDERAVTGMLEDMTEQRL